MFPNVNNYRFSSLSELMVPFPITLQTVQYIEGCASYNVTVEKVSKAGAKRVINNELYTVPYPYTTPISPELSKIGLDINAIDNETYESWRSDIDSRFMPIANFAISKQTLDRIDALQNGGCIVSLLTGYIVAFSYDEFSDMKIVNIPNNLQNLMMNFYRLYYVSEEAVQESGVPKSEMAHTFFEDSYARFYTFNRHGDDPNYLRIDPDHYFSAGTRALTSRQADSINRMVIEAFKRKDRVIITV